MTPIDWHLSRRTAPARPPATRLKQQRSAERSGGNERSAADWLDQDQYRPPGTGVRPCRLAESAARAQPRYFSGDVHFNKPNPNIEFDGSIYGMQSVPAASEHRTTLAGVNSFGFGGTNAHVVVGPGKKIAAREQRLDSRFPSFFTISAETKPALTALARKYIAQLSEMSDAESAVVASAAAHHRDRLSIRAAVAVAQARRR